MNYKDLPKMSSMKFTYENSGIKNAEAPPCCLKSNGEIEEMPFNPLTPIGWTDDPPLFNRHDIPCNIIGIMFENQDFERIWFHFVLYF